MGPPNQPLFAKSMGQFGGYSFAGWGAQLVSADFDLAKGLLLTVGSAQSVSADFDLVIWGPLPNSRQRQGGSPGDSVAARKF